MGFRLSHARGIYPLAFFAFFFLCGSMFYSASSHANSEPVPPVAENGLLDLRAWSFERDGSISLTGEWQFFWQQLIAPGDFSTEQFSYQTVPSIWTAYEDDFSVSGYATYRLRVLLPPDHGALALANDGQGSAYQFWINGEYFRGAGQVGTSKADTVAAKRRIAHFLTDVGDELDIVVQVSNYNHRKAGFRNALLLGQSTDIHRAQYRDSLADAFVFGIILCVGFYFFFMYFSRREDKAPLYFALLCLVVSLRASLTNQNLLGSLFPDALWVPLLKIEYLTFFWALYFYIGFMRSLYPEEYSARLQNSNAFFAASFSVVALIADTLTASKLIPWYQAVHFIYVCALIACFFPLIYRKRPYVLYIASASILVMTFNVLELLHLSGLHGQSYLSHIGFLAFIFVQAMMLSTRSAENYRQITVLSGELEKNNFKLQGSEKKYRSLFEDSFDTIFTTSTDGRIVDANPACERLVGYSPEELGRIEDLDLLMAQEDRAECVQEIAKSGSVIDFQCELTHRDGQQVPVQITATARHDDLGNQIGYQGYVRNISDRLEAKQQRTRAEQLEVFATIDPLTQTFNRRFFEQAAESEQSRARRNGSPLSVILLDIDHFKPINDVHGHLVGDQVLTAVAARAKNEVRKSDIFARFGGEEFVLLMPDTNLDQAIYKAEKIRLGIEQLEVTTESQKTVSVNVSLGVAIWANDQSLNETLEQADQALYRAKESGRNRTEAWVG